MGIKNAEFYADVEIFAMVQWFYKMLIKKLFLILCKFSDFLYCTYLQIYSRFFAYNFFMEQNVEPFQL